MNRATWPWRIVAVGFVALAAMNTGGCDDDSNQEDCFELTGTLAPVTSDTLQTTDHLDPVLSPDGTRVLFTTDAFVEKLGKQVEARDFAIVDVPAPGEWRLPTRTIELEGNGVYVELGRIPDDDGTLDLALEHLKGSASWMPDSQSFVAVIENTGGYNRLYLVTLGVPSAGQVRAESVTLIDDIGLAGVGDFNQYYYITPAVSPDGQWVAYTRYFFRPSGIPDVPDSSQVPAIFAYNFSSGQTVRVTNGSTIEQDPTWSPDGQFIAFTTNGGRVGTNEVYKVRFDPDNPAAERQLGEPFTDGRVRLTTTTGENDLKLPVGSFDPSWAPDGRIVFVSTRRMPCTSYRVRSLWVMNSDGGDPRPIVANDVDDHFPSVANYVGQSSDANGIVVFSTQFNQVEEFDGQKSDIWILRGF